MNHTPTPWEYNSRGDIGSAVNQQGVIIAQGISGATLEEADANKAYIVKCVNSHDALICALKWYVENDDAVDSDTYYINGRINAVAALYLAGIEVTE